jgi:hypothetical protein
MPFDLLDISPPNNTGTDTLRRYRYQAQIAFPFCLSCVTRGPVLSVILEHFEDFVVQYQDYWHFIQVKTRNPELGPWRLTNVLASGGGLDSLSRTFKSVRGLPAKFSLFLEGSVAVSDLLNCLVPPQTQPNNIDLQQRVKDALKLTGEECSTFLNLLTVKPNQPHRNQIVAYNIRILGQQTSHITHQELETIYQRVTDDILSAMACEPLDDLLHLYIRDENGANGEDRLKIEAKRLTPQRLLPLFGSIIEGPYPLLRRIVQPFTAFPSDLEIKLISGGAGEAIIKDAQQLRANADVREYEILGSTFLDADAELQNVRLRVQTLSNAIIQQYIEEDKPAIKAWENLRNRLTSEALTVDPNRIFRQDPYLLLGVACILVDECHITVGKTIA